MERVAELISGSAKSLIVRARFLSQDTMPPGLLRVDLEAQIKMSVDHYNHQCYPREHQKLTPTDVLLRA
jgi:hypothetical protein